MLLKNELKKLYIKQYGLIVLLIVFIVKLLTSADLYKASYSDMSYEQQKYYLEYMQEYGGQLTDEKETAILSLYSEAEAAKQQQSEILEKNRAGEYSTPEEFTNAMREIPDIIEKYDAIKLLYSNYERVSADRENLLMLPSGSNAMTSGIEYLFIMAICYISAAMCYYERKMKPLIVTAANGRRSGGYRLISLFSLIFIGWLGLFIIELTSLFAVIGAENLGCGVQSLEAFENTQFGSLSIIAMFIVNVCRIRLSDYYKEIVLAAPDAQRLSRYLDLLTIWSGDSDDYSYNGMCKYQNNLYLQTNNYKVFVLDLNTGASRLLFSENYINGDISVIDGKVFYLNSDGNPVCFDNEKKIISERMFYAIASDREYIYCSNNSVTYRYKVSDLSEEKFADKGEAYMADRSCVYFGDGTYMDAYGKQVEILQAEDGSIFLANGRVIVKNSDGTLEFSDK